MSPFTEAALITTGLGAAAGAIAADSMDKAPAATALLLWAAGVCTAIGVLWKFLHVGEILTGTRNFLKDYNGEPARPGVEPRPGLPERLASIERHTHEVKGAMPAMVVALEELKKWATENGSKIDKVDDRVTALDQRMTDHRRRNDQTAEVLRSDLERRASELAAKMEARDHTVDEKLNHLSEDLLRAQTYRAALHELGINVESRQKPRDE